MFEEMKRKLEGVVKMIREDLNSIKTGRAKPSLVENVEIEAYGGQWMPLVELASISAPDSNMLIIQPWDQSVLEKIEKGLAASDVQVNPVVDGNLIRITIPPLTEERRKEMVKLVAQKVESAKEMVRGIRNETKRDIDDMEGDAGVSEDDIHEWHEKMQALYDEYMKELDGLQEAKRRELMEI